jgi:ribosome maturation factor RimP
LESINDNGYALNFKTPLQETLEPSKTGGSPFFAFFGYSVLAPKRKNGPSGKTKVGTPKKVAEIIRLIWQEVEPLCESEGFELVHVEFQRETAGRILRLYIDKAGGVTLDDCVYVSRQVGDLLDVTLDDVGTYNLEVSSPGIDRPLGRMEDYNRFKGNTVKIKTVRPVNGRKKFTGMLSGISQGIVQLEIEGTRLEIPFEDISRARLINYGESGCRSQT